jgi:hypothetical protein
MLIEMTIDHEDLPRIREGIERVKESEDWLVIRRGAKVISKDRWIELIEKECDLIPDRRHFDPQWAANDARRNALKHREAVATTAELVKPQAEDQIKPADWWEISYQPEREIAYAYSKTPQPLHTDNAWFGDPAEINFFIMDKQATSGGEQTIYPTSRLIEDLSAKEPGLFHDLSTMEVVIKKGDNDMYNKTNIIKLKAQPEIFWNYYRTDKSSPEVATMCEAFFAFLKRQAETISVEKVRCDTGDCLSFNDLHMLHGRTAFEAHNPRDRVLLHSMWKLPVKK